MTLRIYFAHESISGGGSRHVPMYVEEAEYSEDPCRLPGLADEYGEPGEDVSSFAGFCDHLDAMATERTFKIKSWDCKTSISTVLELCGSG